MAEPFTRLVPRPWLVVGALAYAALCWYAVVIQGSLLLAVAPLVVVAVAYGLSRRAVPA